MMDADPVRSAKGQTMASILFFRDFPAHSRYTAQRIFRTFLGHFEPIFYEIAKLKHRNAIVTNVIIL